MDVNGLIQQISALDQSYNPTDTYNKITTQLGIPDARTRVQALQSNLVNTENAIRAVDPNVTARTSGALVTEAQRGHLVNTEKAPLTDTYNQQNQAYGMENNALAGLTGQASQLAGLEQSNYQNKRGSLATQLDVALKQEAARQAKAEADRQYALEQQKLRASQASSSSRGAQGNPAQDFLDYIANQFKGAGGQGNKKITRQTQDAWANAWFAQNGVSKNNRQQYWNLFNNTYNRTDDPTKDWRYAR